jgi:hypothetical protein
MDFDNQRHNNANIIVYSCIKHNGIISDYDIQWTIVHNST